MVSFQSIHFLTFLIYSTLNIQGIKKLNTPLERKVLNNKSIITWNRKNPLILPVSKKHENQQILESNLYKRPKINNKISIAFATIAVFNALELSNKYKFKNLYISEFGIMLYSLVFNHMNSYGMIYKFNLGIEHKLIYSLFFIISYSPMLMVNWAQNKMTMNVCPLAFFCGAYYKFSNLSIGMRVGVSYGLLKTSNNKKKMLVVPLWFIKYTF